MGKGPAARLGQHFGASGGTPDDPLPRSSDVSLRNADWRLIVPSAPEGGYRKLALFGASAALAKRFLDAGIANEIAGADGQGEQCDAVIVLSGGTTQISLKEAAHLVASGGILYYEVDRAQPALATLTPMRARMQTAIEGLRATGTYWIPEQIRSRRLYLPLERPLALRWFLRTNGDASTCRQYVRNRLLRLALRFGEWPLRARVRRYALTAIRGERDAAAPWILANPDLPGPLRNPELVPVVIANGDDELGRLVMLPFGPRDRAPRAALKCSRIASRNALSEAEQVGLSTLRRDLTPDLARALPEPLGVLSWGDISVSVESCLQGRTMPTIIQRWGCSERRKWKEFDAAAEWITAFNEAAQVSSEVWTSTDVERWIGGPAGEYLRYCRVDEDTTELIQLLLSESRSLIGVRIPIVWQHYAFGPWNICRERGRIGVFDWEGYSESLPLFDLLFFSTHWYAAANGLKGHAEELEGFRKLFCSPPRPGSTEARIDREFRGYLNAFGLPARYRPIAVTLFWLTRSISIAARARAVGSEGDEDVRVKYLRLLARNRAWLFAGTSE